MLRMPDTNQFGQPLGAAVPSWTPRGTPDALQLEGAYCTLRRFSAEHIESLFGACADDERLWTYLPFGPFASPAEMAQMLGGISDATPYAIVVDAKVLGTASYMRCRPEHGSVEVGAVLFAPALQRSAAATEAMYLMAKHAFELGYRRYEWKCDALNAGSRRAALRFGFTYEGTFRSDRVVKGRSRDTAWFSMLQGEWPEMRKAFEGWLHSDNFDETGAQRRSLASFHALETQRVFRRT